MIPLAILRNPVLYFLLASAILLSFGQSLRVPFAFDDHVLLVDPVITSPDGYAEVWHWRQSRPLTWFSFWLNYRIHGEDPSGYHAFNLIVHILSSCLFFRATSRLIPRSVAVVAAFFFALHPIQTEAVVYIFARSTLLCTLFCLLSLNAWLGGRHWLGTLWFGVALLAKEECAAFPVFLLLLHLAISRNAGERRPIAAMLGLASMAAARVAVLAAITPGSGAGAQAGISSGAYLLTQGYSILRYLQLLAIPIGFTVDPDIPVLADWRGALCWITLAVLAGLALRDLPKARVGFWFLGALILLAPTSSFFPAADLAADRRIYLPMLAFAPLAALLLVRTSFPILLFAGAVLCGMLSYARTDVWLAEATLWEDAMRWTPNKIRPRIQLSRVSATEQALRLLGEARTIAPNDAGVASELGRVYLTDNRPSEALAEFGRAVALQPNDSLALNNRGVALLALGLRDHALADFRRSLEINPCLLDARLNLQKSGEPSRAPPNCRWTPQQIALFR